MTLGFGNILVPETNRFAMADNNNQRLSPIIKDKLFGRNEPSRNKAISFVVTLLPTVGLYWSTTELYKTTLFRGVMSSNCFQLVLRFWGLANNTWLTEHRLYKVQPVLDHFSGTRTRDTNTESNCVNYASLMV